MLASQLYHGRTDRLTVGLDLWEQGNKLGLSGGGGGKGDTCPGP